MADTLLLIEDETLLREELARRLERAGWDVVPCVDLAGARHALIDDELSPLVVLSDMALPDGNALDLLEEVRGAGPQATAPGGEWILLTGYGTVADSVRALKLGAFDFLEKPCDQKRLDLVVAGAARSARAQRRVREQARQQNQAYPLAAFLGNSEAARRTREVLAKLADVPFSALVIGGETGTGKGLAARILHGTGRRAQGPLVEVNCAALPRELLESQLFGHEAGAFTGARRRHRGFLEQANGGTLFLDEIAEMDLELQAKLLKVIEDQRVRPLGSEREVVVDVQIVAASNRNLAERAAEGEFRGDLYHRLSVFELVLPPLRERLEDLDELVPAIVAEFNAKAGRDVREIPEPVWAALRSHDWPGNVRELRNVIERCVLFSQGPVFPAEWLQLPGRGRKPAPDAEAPAPHAAASPGGEGGGGLWIPLDGTLSLEDIDRFVVKGALERAGGNLTAAARLLGTTRQPLRYRAQKYGLKSPHGEGVAGEE